VSSVLTLRCGVPRSLDGRPSPSACLWLSATARARRSADNRAGNSVTHTRARKYMGTRSHTLFGSLALPLSPSLPLSLSLSLSLSGSGSGSLWISSSSWLSPSHHGRMLDGARPKELRVSGLCKKRRSDPVVFLYK
jgi:hypothetical protein